LHGVIHKLKVEYSVNKTHIHLIAESTNTRAYPKARFHRRFWLSSMSEREAGPYHSVARKWLALVERRQENFIDICNSGRWRQYYTRAEIVDEMRKLRGLRDQWAINAGLPPSGEDEPMPQWALSLDKIYDASQPSEPSAGVLARRAWARLDRTRLDWVRLNQPEFAQTGLAGS